MIFHGWLQLEVEEIESETSDEELRRQDEAILTVKRRIDSESDSISRIEVGRGGNHMVVLTAHGILNHRHEKVIEMFRWLLRIRKVLGSFTSGMTSTPITTIAFVYIDALMGSVWRWMTHIFLHVFQRSKLFTKLKKNKTEKPTADRL